MLSSRRIVLALSAVSLTLLSQVSPALATGPATVTVRVEGESKTLVLPKQVTTTTQPVVNDGKPEDSCPGTSALGALQLATGGNWSGPWSTSFNQYEIDSIEGESHPFFSGAFWDLWTNHTESLVGACGAELEPGEEVLFYPCPEAAPACPGPLGIALPESATVGTPVPVKISKYSSSGMASAVVGATVTGAAATVITGPGGEASLSFSAPGKYTTVSASAPEAVRAESTICVEASGEGTCPKPSTASLLGSSKTTGSAGGGTSTGGSSAKGFGASLLGLVEGHVYGPRQAPRLLSGSVNAAGAVGEVKLRLTRRWRTRAGRVHCSFYSGVTDAFKGMRCGAGHGHFFSAGSKSSFSYLLPSALAPGRYVLDLEATNGAGERTKLARGSTRLVFFVR